MPIEIGRLGPGCRGAGKNQDLSWRRCLPNKVETAGSMQRKPQPPFRCFYSLVKCPCQCPFERDGFPEVLRWPKASCHSSRALLIAAWVAHSVVKWFPSPNPHSVDVVRAHPWNKGIANLVGRRKGWACLFLINEANSCDTKIRAVHHARHRGCLAFF